MLQYGHICCLTAVEDICCVQKQSSSQGGWGLFQGSFLPIDSLGYTLSAHEAFVFLADLHKALKALPLRALEGL